MLSYNLIISYQFKNCITNFKIPLERISGEYDYKSYKHCSISIIEIK